MPSAPSAPPGHVGRRLSGRQTVNTADGCLLQGEGVEVDLDNWDVAVYGGVEWEGGGVVHKEQLGVTSWDMR